MLAGVRLAIQQGLERLGTDDVRGRRPVGVEQRQLTKLAALHAVLAMRTARHRPAPRSARRPVRDPARRAAPGEAGA